MVWHNKRYSIWRVATTEREHDMTILLITDGACKGNPGPGGWCALLRHGPHERMLSGSHRETTNNRMELLAVIEGLRALKRPSEVKIITDSQYVLKGFTEYMPGWQASGFKGSRGKSIANVDLWYDLLVVAAGHRLDWEWVRGHAGHADNERVDAEAQSQALRAKTAALDLQPAI